jgi:hypothetical protein
MLMFVAIRGRLIRVISARDMSREFIDRREKGTAQIQK